MKCKVQTQDLRASLIDGTTVVGTDHEEMRGEMLVEEMICGRKRLYEYAFPHLAR